MKPIYAENLVVAIKHDDCLEWYILEKDYCFLDYTKLEKAYQQKGYDVAIDVSQRFGIKTINEATKKIFLRNIEKYKTSTEELNKMLMREIDYNDKLAYNPSLLIDFEKKILISYYSEPESFEKFVPEGWNGEYRNFAMEIPKDQRYWVDKSGKNMIGD